MYNESFFTCRVTWCNFAHQKVTFISCNEGDKFEASLAKLDHRVRVVFTLHVLL